MLTKSLLLTALNSLLINSAVLYTLSKLYSFSEHYEVNPEEWPSQSCVIL